MLYGLLEQEAIYKIRCISDVSKVFSCEETCRDYLIKTVYDGSPKCHKCLSEGLTPECYYLQATERYKCKRCSTQYTLKFATIFESSKMPLSKWFTLIAHCLIGLGSAHDMTIILDVNPKTAYYNQMKLRYALAPDLGDFKLKGEVEIDEYLQGAQPNKNLRLMAKNWKYKEEQKRLHGDTDYIRRKKDKAAGKAKGAGKPKGVKNGEGKDKIKHDDTRHKTAVLGIRQRNGPALFFNIGMGKSAFNKENIYPYLCKYIDPDSTIFTDNATYYKKGLKNIFKNHYIINHKKESLVFNYKTGKSGREYVRWEDGIMVTTNHIELDWRHVKAAWSGTHYGYTSEQTMAYLFEYSAIDKGSVTRDNFQEKFNELLKTACSTSIPVELMKRFTIITEQYTTRCGKKKVRNVRIPRPKKAKVNTGISNRKKISEWNRKV